MQLIREVKQFFGDAGFQPFGYTGYQKEEAGGLYYAQARRYDANTGRFISEDKIKGFITMPVTLNAYGYCWGNPMGYVDGRWPEVSDIVKKIYSNGVAQYKNWVKEKNGAVTFKISANATALLGVYADIGVSVDWNVKIDREVG